MLISYSILLLNIIQVVLEGKEFVYEPGDAFGFVCPNDKKEVDYLLERSCICMCVLCMNACMYVCTIKTKCNNITKCKCSWGIKTHQKWVTRPTKCVCPVYVTTSALFTGTNAVKFVSTVTWSSWVLLLSYYRASIFLPCRISRPKMKELSATVVKNQPFWHSFP